MIKHIVFFKINVDNKPEELRKLKSMIEDLGKTVPDVIKIEAGINFSERDAAYDIALVSEFRDRKALAAYQVHPEHQKLVEYLKGLDREVAVVDYEE